MTIVAHAGSIRKRPHYANIVRNEMRTGRSFSKRAQFPVRTLLPFCRLFHFQIAISLFRWNPDIKFRVMDSNYPLRLKMPLNRAMINSARFKILVGNARFAYVSLAESRVASVTQFRTRWLNIHNGRVHRSFGGNTCTRSYFLDTTLSPFRRVSGSKKHERKVTYRYYISNIHF